MQTLGIRPQQRRALAKIPAQATPTRPPTATATATRLPTANLIRPPTATQTPTPTRLLTATATAIQTPTATATATRPLTATATAIVTGRYGSGAMERALGTASESFGRALGDVTANIVGQDYARERGFQQQALGALGTAAQLAPQFYAQQFLPSQTLAQVGAQREAIAGQPLQEAIQRYQYQQQLPYAQLSGYLSSIYGSPLGSLGQQPQQQGNSFLQNLGAGLNILGTAQKLFPSTTSQVTNFLGGLLG